MPGRFATQLSCLALLTGTLTACAGEDAAPDAAADRTPSPSVSASESVAAVVASPVEGAWEAGPAPYSQVASHLVEHDLGTAVDAVLGDTAPSSTYVYELKLQDGFALLSSTVDGAPKGLQDRERYEITGDRIALTPEQASCSTTFRWKVAGDRLALTLLTDTCPRYQGTPDEAFMRSLYSAAPFVRKS
jgi:hypothetical protein